MKKYLISLSLITLPFVSIASTPPPLLKDLPVPNFKHIKVKSQYKVTYMFMDFVGVLSLNEAIKEWNKALGVDLFVLDDTAPDISISTIPLTPGLEGIALPYINNSCTIALSESGASDYRIIMHELGHCIGLAHQEDTCGSLMHPDPVCITKFKKLDKDTIKYLKEEIKKSYKG